MPNTPAAIGRGISVAFAKDNVSAAQKEMCDALLQAAGAVAWTDDEANLDAVTAVSGSGPAYVFLLAECLEEAAVDAGLERELARQLARETVSGAGELLRRSDVPASRLQGECHVSRRHNGRGAGRADGKRRSAGFAHARREGRDTALPRTFVLIIEPETTPCGRPPARTTFLHLVGGEHVLLCIVALHI